ncbi:translocation/assembly module TamB [Mesonia sp. K7]|uniref:translocation/assembly module TamB domain-containing protein n=1 Tax=Mesonia sp. K7 TaxID=2218606 RepID=UPI001F184003|nr:translocation/assembly module TamB [Mesonia sp. K7]
MQTYVGKKVSENLKETYDVDINVGKISLSYDGEVVLQDVLIKDHHQNKLIKADQLNTVLLNLPGLLSGTQLDFGYADADGLELHMRRYKGEENDNLNVFVGKFSKDTTSTSDFSLNLDKIDVINGQYSYVDENLENSEILFLDQLNINAENLLVDNSDVFVNIHKLNGKENRGFDIEQLTAKFSYTQDKIELKNMVLQTPESLLNGDVSLLYEQVEGLSDFENKVNLKADFEGSKLANADLYKLYNEVNQEGTLYFEGNLSGTLNDLQLDNWQMTGMDRTVIDGDIHLKNLLTDNPDAILITGNFNNLETNYYDLVNFLPNVLGKTLPQEIKQIGNIRLEGELEASPLHVKTNSLVYTQLGNANLDITLSDIKNFDNASYNGKIAISNFNLGRLLNNNSLGKTSFDLVVDGVGFTPESVNTTLKGNIKNFTFNKYTYRNIKVSGNLKNPIFNGIVTINDPNLELDFDGLIDISENQNIYDFDADIKKANLNALKFIERDSLSIFKGKLDIDMRGTTIDNVVGDIQLTSANYQNQTKNYVFDTLTITSNFENDERIILVNSPDFLKGELRGKFKIAEVPAMFENSIGSLYTNYNPIPIEEHQYLSFDFDIYSKGVEIFVPDLSFENETYFRGSVESDEKDFKFNFKSPYIKYANNTFREINVQIDNSNPLFNAFVEIDSINAGFYNASDFNLINKTLNDTLFVRSRFKGGTNNVDNFNLSLYHTINENNESVLGFKKSDFQFKESKWNINASNSNNQKIVINKDLKSFSLDTLLISHQNEVIGVSAKMTDTTYKNIKIDFNNVDLGKITPTIDSLDLAGRINGELNFLQREGIYYPSSSLEIKGVAINDTEYGNLNLNIEGNNSLTSYNIDAILRDDEYDFAKAKGSINVDDENPKINLDVSLEQFKLDAFSALGAEILTNIRGFATGKAKISGDYNNPNIEGRINLSEAGATFPLLNVDLAFEEDAIIDLSKQKFIFNEIDITDTKYNTKGVINGDISHENFAEWKMNLGLTASDRLLVLDTPPTEDALYYGTAFISGFASITGPVDELFVEVIATTEEGTVFKIPLNDATVIGDHSFIHFLTPEEKEAREKGEEVIIPEVKGVELFFDLDITDDAEVEVVVDPETGSSLRGRGAGILNIAINTNGKFKMFGDFTVYEGVYNFKYGGLVEKEFLVEEGGTITWDGDPMNANLNVRAKYQTYANPAILLENPTINRDIPVDVFINLNGELISTDLSFDLEYPNLSSIVRSELEYKINDRQSTEIQALSLITQGAFFSQQDTGGNAPGNLLIEKASSLFDQIFKDDDGKFQVGINYVQGDRTADQDTADRFGVTLSTQIGKKVFVNGNFGVPMGGVTESIVIGNVEVELLLNEDGSLRGKVFNRENNIQYIGEQLGYTQGVGVAYSVDFDTFKELISKILNKEYNRVKEEEEQENEDEEENQESLAPSYIEFPGN